MQFRVALRDQASQRIGTAGQFIEGPNLKNHRLALSGLILWSPQTLSGAENAISGSPGVRQFRQGSEIGRAYSIYNPPLDQATHLPQLTTETRIFRDGKLVYAGKPTPLDVTGQSDLQRITNASRMMLGVDFPTGDYVLQVSVIETLSKEKRRITTQSTDFEIVK